MSVLGCKRESGVNICQEWDAVIGTDRNPTIDERKLVFTACDATQTGLVRPVMTLTAGNPDISVNFNNFDRATSILFDILLVP